MVSGRAVNFTPPSVPAVAEPTFMPSKYAHGVPSVTHDGEVSVIPAAPTSVSTNLAA